MQPFREYYESLDSALVEHMNGNRNRLQLHCDRWGMSAKLPAHGTAREAAICKLVTARTSLPIGIRKKAKRWLAEHGFQSWDDGEL